LRNSDADKGWRFLELGEMSKGAASKKVMIVRQIEPNCKAVQAKEV